jgi:hypothetical protein
MKIMMMILILIGASIKYSFLMIYHSQKTAVKLTGASICRERCPPSPKSFFDIVLGNIPNLLPGTARLWTQLLFVFC